VYRHIAQPALAGRIAAKDHPQVGLTEHALDESRRALVLINYSPQPVSTHLTLAEGWRIGEVWRGAAPAPRANPVDITLPANDACVLIASSSVGRQSS
jgi:hypothetical protein